MTVRRAVFLGGSGEVRFVLDGGRLSVEIRFAGDDKPLGCRLSEAETEQVRRLLAQAEEPL